MASGNFTNCLTQILRQEGGYADNPRDPGGATNFGITRKTLARWRRVSPWWSLAKSDVRDLSQSEATDIYRALFWNRIAGTGLPKGLDLAVFDYAVNSGPDRAVKALQALVGTRPDGIVGPLTLAAVRERVRAGEGTILIRALSAKRLGFLRTLATFSVFGRGWTRRVATIEAAACVMRPAGEPKSPQQRRSKMNILAGSKTYIVAAAMLLSAIAQIAGVDIPGFDNQSAGHLLMEALAIFFLRKGLKNDVFGA